jgi:O-succinylbenzoate synthase
MQPIDIRFTMELLMNEPTEMQLLVGQLTADALIRDALLIALMEVIPDLHARLESKVAATAPACESQIPLQSRDSYRTRLSEVRELLSSAYP